MTNSVTTNGWEPGRCYATRSGWVRGNSTNSATTSDSEPGRCYATEKEPNDSLTNLWRSDCCAHRCCGTRSGFRYSASCCGCRRNGYHYYGLCYGCRCYGLCYGCQTTSVWYYGCRMTSACLACYA